MVSPSPASVSRALATVPSQVLHWEQRSTDVWARRSRTFGADAAYKDYFFRSLCQQEWLYLVYTQTQRFLAALRLRVKGWYWEKLEMAQAGGRESGYTERRCSVDSIQSEEAQPTCFRRAELERELKWDSGLQGQGLLPAMVQDRRGVGALEPNVSAYTADPCSLLSSPTHICSQWGISLILTQMPELGLVCFQGAFRESWGTSSNANIPMTAFKNQVTQILLGSLKRLSNGAVWKSDAWDAVGNKVWKFGNFFSSWEQFLGIVSEFRNLRLLVICGQ